MAAAESGARTLSPLMKYTKHGRATFAGPTGDRQGRSSGVSPSAHCRNRDAH